MIEGFAPMFVNLSKKLASYRLKPISGIELINKRTRTWSITGDDPHFMLVRRFKRRLPSGYYRVLITGAKHLNRLRHASFYLDTGHGFNEGERINLSFQEEDGRTVAYISLDTPVRRIRFDPAEGVRVVFSGRAVYLERIDAAEFSRSVLSAKNIREPRHLGDGALNLLVNLYRLLPAHGGAGGAGRLALAYLRYLPEFANVRVLIASHNEGLIREFPDVEFVLCRSESLGELEEHLYWCNCYFDFLNGLRPTYIPPRVAVLSCLLDLQHMRLPMLFSETELNARMREYGYAIDRADGLIAISEYERHNLQYFYEKDNVSVVPLSGFAAEDYFENADGRQTRRKRNCQSYFVYPAVPWPHKNHEALIQAVAILKKTDRSIRLVLTNTASSFDNRARLMRLSEAFGLGDVIEFRGFISEPELIDLMRNSAGMLFPSLYEGFGIPLVDAMKLEIPILASRIEAITEVCGDGAAYFANHRNAMAMAEDIWRFSREREEKTQRVGLGIERGRLYSSRRMAEGIAHAARRAVIARQQNPRELTRSLPRQPEVKLLAILIYVTRSDLVASEDFASAISKLTNATGSQVEITIALDINAIACPAAAALEQYDRLIIFDAGAPNSRAIAAEEFCRRYNSGDFHMITNWSERDKFSSSQLAAMIEGLRHHPEAKYAIIDNAVDDLAWGTSVSEVETIDQFEELRGTDPIVYGVMIRGAEPFRRIYQGTTQFLSTFCSEKHFVRVPLIKASSE